VAVFIAAVRLQSYQEVVELAGVEPASEILHTILIVIKTDI
jgi:hypothetical protein